MAFEKIHRPLFAESKHVDFPNNNSVSTSYNGAFCKVRSILLLSRRLCNYLDETAEKSCYRPPCPGGGGRVLPYINYISMCRSIGWGFWAVLVWKRVYTLPILVWNRVWFSRELRECMNVFIVSIPNEWERKRNMRIRNGFEVFFFGLRSNLSNDNIISA